MSKTNQPQIRGAETGKSFPRIDLLEKWLHVYGWSLSRFFGEIESEAASGKPVPEDPLEPLRTIASHDPEFAVFLSSMAALFAKRLKNKPH